jgi:nucleoside-diphosphate-sugar epimerase
MSQKKIITVFGATGAQGGGLVRAILADKNSEFSVRAVTRDLNSDKAKELAALGAELVKADLAHPENVRKAMKGAYGAYCVTFFWAHFSPEQEAAEARCMMHRLGGGIILIHSVKRCAGILHTAMLLIILSGILIRMECHLMTLQF